MLLQKLSKEEFESLRGNTFTTVNTDCSYVVVRSRYPEFETPSGEKYQGYHFDTYEDYREFVEAQMGEDK